MLGVHLLGVERILVVPHTRCAMALHTERRAPASGSAASAGQDASWQPFHVVDDQLAALRRGRPHEVRTHPLIPDTVEVGGFMYDVDTGLISAAKCLSQRCSATLRRPAPRRRPRRRPAR